MGNPDELVKYMLPNNRNQQAILVSNIIPASLAADDGSAKKGLLVTEVNGMKVRTMDELCSALNGKVGKDAFWSLKTSKTFTAFKLQDVLSYEKSRAKDPQHASFF